MCRTCSTTPSPRGCLSCCTRGSAVESASYSLTLGYDTTPSRKTCQTSSMTFGGKVFRVDASLLRRRGGERITDRARKARDLGRLPGQERVCLEVNDERRWGALRPKARRGGGWEGVVGRVDFDHREPCGVVAESCLRARGTCRVEDATRSQRSVCPTGRAHPNATARRSTIGCPPVSAACSIALARSRAAAGPGSCGDAVAASAGAAPRPLPPLHRACRGLSR